MKTYSVVRRKYSHCTSWGTDFSQLLLWGAKDIHLGVTDCYNIKPNLCTLNNSGGVYFSPSTSRRKPKDLLASLRAEMWILSYLDFNFQEVPLHWHEIYVLTLSLTFCLSCLNRRRIEIKTIMLFVWHLAERHPFQLSFWSLLRN